MTWFTWAWIIWIGWFVIVEGIAIYQKDKGDTLSEHVWALFKIRDQDGWHPRRIILAGFMVWLLVHMVAGF